MTTVKQLIEYLESQPQDAEVYVGERQDREFAEVPLDLDKHAFYSEKNNIVYLLD